MQNKLRPIHPGEILLKEFLEPMNLSMNQLGRRINVPPARISEICRGRRSITADTALRLSKVFSTSVELWLGLQSHYEMKLALEEHQAEYVKIEPLIVLKDELHETD